MLRGSKMEKVIKANAKKDAVGKTKRAKKTKKTIAKLEKRLRKQVEEETPEQKKLRAMCQAKNYKAYEYCEFALKWAEVTHRLRKKL